MKAMEKLLKKLNLTEDDFKPKKEETTIEDVVEALNVLAEIVLAESEVE